MPAPDGAGAPVVHVAPEVCGRCGEWTVAWGVEVDGLEDMEVVGLCGAPVPGGARARTFVALVAAVVRGRGWVVMVAVLRVEVEELWCRAPPAINLPTAALPYVPGCGGGTSGCWARRATGMRGRGIPLPREKGRHQPLGCPLNQAPAAAEKIPQLVAMGAANDPHGPLRVTHQPAAGEREAGGKGEDAGAPVVAVHGANGAPTVQ